MGHEYIEIKNTNAAIASYRRAVGESSVPYVSSCAVNRYLRCLGHVPV